jgi:hypothetical protein
MVISYFTGCVKALFEMGRIMPLSWSRVCSEPTCGITKNIDKYRA